MPALRRDPCLSAEGIKHFFQTSNAVGWKLQCLLDIIHQPAQNHFACTQVCIPLEKLLEGGNVLPDAGVVAVEWSKDSINGVEKLSKVHKSCHLVPLDAHQEVVDIHIKFADRAGEWA